MKSSNRTIIVVQWIVIAALIIGAGVAVYMLMGKADEYRNAVKSQESSMQSMREQVRQAQNPTPVPPTPLPEATANGPSPTPTPKR